MILLRMVPSYAHGTIKETPPEGTASWQSSLWEDTLPMSAFLEAESSQLTSRKATRKLGSYLTAITVTKGLATPRLIHSVTHGQTTTGLKHFQKRRSHQMYSLKITLRLSHNKPLKSRPLQKTKRTRRNRMEKMIRTRRIYRRRILRMLHQLKHRHLWVKSQFKSRKMKRKSRKSKKKRRKRYRNRLTKKLRKNLRPSSRTCRKIKLRQTIRLCSLIKLKNQMKLLIVLVLPKR